MELTLADLEIGDVATIESFDVEKLPMKLIEMGCLPGKFLYIKRFDGSHIANFQICQR